MSTPVTPQELVQALHATYARTIGNLHQEVAELAAANARLVRERDEYRAAAQTPPEPIPGIFRQEGQPDQEVPIHPIG